MILPWVLFLKRATRPQKKKSLVFMQMVFNRIVIILSKSKIIKLDSMEITL
jgi:hypothetical protein